MVLKVVKDKIDKDTTKVVSKSSKDEKKEKTTEVKEEKKVDVKPKRTGIPKEYKGLIMVKKSPIYKPYKGITIDEVSHLGNEIVAIDPKSPKVRVMLKNGNLQFVSNQIRKSPTGKYPRILEV